MFKTFQNQISAKVQTVKKTLAAAEMAFTHPMEKYVNTALADGILTEEEENDLYILAERKNIDRMDFKFFLAEKLEAKKNENWNIIKALVENAIVDHKISAEEETIIFTKAKALHLNSDDFKAYYLSVTRNLEKNINDDKKSVQVFDTIEQAKNIKNEIEMERNNRKKTWKQQQKIMHRTLEEENLKNTSKNDVERWWSTLSKEERHQAMDSSGVTKGFFSSIGDQDRKTMYNREVVTYKVKEQLNKKMMEHFQDVSAIYHQENVRLNEMISNLSAISQDVQKTYKVNALITKIEAMVNVNINIDLNINVDIKVDDKFVDKIFSGADKLLNNDTFKHLLAFGAKKIITKR